MTPEQVFSFVNILAMAGWLLLIFAGGRRWSATIAASVFVPLLLGVFYAGLVLAHWGETSGGFGSLAGVSALFSNQWLLLAGWIHYLAFDLFVGSWEVRDSESLSIPRLLVVPCLVMTFLFGPAGFLLYMLVRVIRTRKLAIGNAQ